jgi:hypothetical protein
MIPEKKFLHLQLHYEENIGPHISSVTIIITWMSRTELGIHLYDQNPKVHDGNPTKTGGRKEHFF